jgi:hypothetical protein
MDLHGPTGPLMAVAAKHTNQPTWDIGGSPNNHDIVAGSQVRSRQ